MTDIVTKSKVDLNISILSLAELQFNTAECIKKHTDT